MAYEVIGIKLSTGEEIIGKLTTVSTSNLSAQNLFEQQTGTSKGSEIFNPTTGNKLPDAISIYDVRLIYMQQVSATQVSMGLTTWVYGNQDGEFQINLKQHALTVYRPSKDVESAYMEHTSPITLAKAGSIPNLRG